MSAKVARQVLPSDIGWPEVASDAEKKEIEKIVDEVLKGFEADYRQKIKARTEK